MSWLSLDWLSLILLLFQLPQILDILAKHKVMKVTMFNFPSKQIQTELMKCSGGGSDCAAGKCSLWVCWKFPAESPFSCVAKQWSSLVLWAVISFTALILSHTSINTILAHFIEIVFRLRLYKPYFWPTITPRLEVVFRTTKLFSAYFTSFWARGIIIDKSHQWSCRKNLGYSWLPEL